jgi:hypothetical protein
MVDAPGLSDIGTPYCGCRDDQEMEPMEPPIPTVVHIDYDESKSYVGVVLRPVNIQRAKFKKKIAKLWRQWVGFDEDEDEAPVSRQTLQEFLEANDIMLLKSDEVVVTTD